MFRWEYRRGRDHARLSRQPTHHAAAYLWRGESSFVSLHRNLDVTNLSQILQYILSQPRMFAPLIELDLFLDVHNVPAGPEPGIDTPRERICRMCATEVLLYGLKDWWVRERKKGFLDTSVTERPDCPEGPTCRRQKEQGMFFIFCI